MILNFSRWKAINEQKAKPKQTITPLPVKAPSLDPEIANFLMMFNSEFLPTLLGGSAAVSKMTVAQYIDALSKLTNDQLNSAIQFFTNKGYNQKGKDGNPDIKKFQEFLMSDTKYKTYTTRIGKTRAFNDGVFGIHTSHALIDYGIDKMKAHPEDLNKTVGSLREVGNSSEPKVKAAVVNTQTDINTGVDTQKIP